MMDPCRFLSGTYDTAAAPCHQMDWFLSGFLPIEAAVSIFIFLGGRDPGEGERFLSRSPFPLPLSLTSCLILHESPLEHSPLQPPGCPSPHFWFLHRLFVGRCSTCGSAVSGLEYFYSVFWVKDLLGHICQACVAWQFFPCVQGRGR